MPSHILGKELLHKNFLLATVCVCVCWGESLMPNNVRLAIDLRGVIPNTPSKIFELFASYDNPFLPAQVIAPHHYRGAPWY